MGRYIELLVAMAECVLVPHLLVPILNILFKIDTTKYEYIPMDIYNLNKDVLLNNGYYYINYIIDQYGAFITLVFMGLVLISRRC